jgi:CRP-like cAMP-binding protein
MSYQLLLDNISKCITLPKDEEDYFVSLLKIKKVKRKQFLLQEEEVQKQAIFVTEGCLRGYAIDKNGFEHILQFAPPGWWIADMNSLLNQEPGILYIDAIFNSEVLLLSKTDQDELFIRIPGFERFFRILSERSFASYQYRMVDSLSLSALERYHNFCKLYPSLIECLPQKQVASYIGVTPEFLSAILNKKIPAK